MKVTASDADDPTYGSSARVVYSVLDGERFFTVDRYTGKNDKDRRRSLHLLYFFFLLIRFSCATFLLHNTICNLKLRDRISQTNPNFGPKA